MRISEIASAEEQIELWKLVSNNMWQALQQQQQQHEELKRKVQATAKKKATPKLKGGARSVRPIPSSPLSPPPPPLPPPNKGPQPPAEKVGASPIATLATAPAQSDSVQKQASAFQKPLSSVETADKTQRYALQNMDGEGDDRHSKNTFLPTSSNLKRR